MMSSRNLFLGALAILCALIIVPTISYAQTTEINPINKLNLAAEIAEGQIVTEVPTWDGLVLKEFNRFETPGIPGINVGVVLFDNGPIVNSSCPATGDLESIIVAGTNSYGYNFNWNGPYYVADDFTVPVGETWTIDYMTTYGYQTGSAPVSTFTDLYVRVWNGEPGQPGSIVIWGDMVTNRLSETSFSGIYRGNANCTTSRPLMNLKADLNNTSFTAGTYWIEWAAVGTAASGPWIPPISITGQPVTGNAIQFGGTYSPLVSGVNAQGLPFTLYGPPGPVFTTQPDPVITCERTSATFTVTANGSGVLAYQWKKDGVIIPGATTSTYSIPSVALTDAGNYSCLVTDNSGSTLSNSAALTVQPSLPPTIIGNTTVCQGMNEEYFTDVNMTGYNWRVSSGGRILYGNDYYGLTVEWTEPGNHSLFVSYSNGNGCLTEETELKVLVHPAPIPVIIGENLICLSNDSFFYETDAGFADYRWTIKGKGRILSGEGTQKVEIQWTGTGTHDLEVTYRNPNGCYPTKPSVLYVLVNEIPPAPGIITGPSIICTNSGVVTFSVDPVPLAYSYVWTVPDGATITSGHGTNNLSVIFPTVVQGNISVYAYNNCGNGPVSQGFPVAVGILPVSAGKIFGASELCENNLTLSYYVDPVINALGYYWNIPDGAEVIGEGDTENITIKFPGDLTSGQITVQPYNMCGPSTNITTLDLKVYPTPLVPVITAVGSLVSSSAPSGNQWYLNGIMIPGATDQSFEAEVSGEYYCIVTLHGCSSQRSNKLQVIGTGIQQLELIDLEIYPNPNNGEFIIKIYPTVQEDGFLTVYNSMGTKILERRIELVSINEEQRISLNPVTAGWYVVSLRQGSQLIIKKILVL